MLPLRSYDWTFCDKQDCRNADLVFGLRDRFAARQWLQRFRDDALRMNALRSLVARYGSWQLSGMTDEDVIEQCTDLLVSGSLHVHAPPEPKTSTTLVAPPPPKPVPFPLSERNPRKSASSQPPAPDPPTFPPGTALNAQAATLIAAAAQGAPFCPQ
jgi:hypothetical protein